MSHSDGAGAEPALGTTCGEAAVFPGRAGRAPARGVRRNGTARFSSPMRLTPHMPDGRHEVGITAQNRKYF